MRDAVHSRITDPGRHAAAVAALPDDLDALVTVVQGLLVHVHLAEHYGITVTDDAAVHERRAEGIIDRVLALDPAPLAVARRRERRAFGNCRQVSVLLTSLLRAHGRPARARCGFGAYFVEGSYEDHWVGETQVDGRWVLVDAQLDADQRELFGIDFPITDVPRDRFVVAGDAWVGHREGRIDADRCGLGLMGEAGPWWIAGNLIRDAVSLAGTPLLPWDAWGAMVPPGTELDDDRIDLLDHLAVLTADPDAHADELAHLVADDPRLRIPDQVFNSLRSRPEPV